MVAIPGRSACIDRYEAARSNATMTTLGTTTTVVSRAGVRPWGGATAAQAVSGCAAAGKRLCTRAEWQAACEGGTGRTYPYGSTYDATACNTSGGVSPPDGGSSLANGMWPGCQGGVPGLFDLAGHLQELNADLDTTSAGCTAAAPCRRASGSTYFQGEPESRCSFSTANQGLGDGHVGFRCCRDAP